MKFIVTGYPDEENMYHGHHTRPETWICEARDRDDAINKGFDHFYYFHEVNAEEYHPNKK